MQEDTQLVAQAKSLSKPAKIIEVKPLQSALDLWEPICLKGDSESSEALLLLPEGYTFAVEDDPLEMIGEVKTDC